MLRHSDCGDSTLPDRVWWLWLLSLASVNLTEYPAYLSRYMPARRSIKVSKQVASDPCAPFARSLPRLRPAAVVYVPGSNS